MDWNRIRHHLATFKRSSSKCQQKEKSPMVKSYKVSNEIKINDVTRREVPNATCFLSISKTLSETFGTYKLKCDFDPFTP